MQSPEGGYYSSTDADSEGEEGKYFVWTPEEIHAVLGEADGRVVCEYYDVRAGGNFEQTGKSALWIPKAAGDVAAKLRMPADELLRVVQRSRLKLLAERLKRVPPGLDDKILTDWNGLMISAMAFGSLVLSEPRYLQSATRAAESTLKHQWDGYHLMHTRRAGRSHLEGMLSDYANLSLGLLNLYQASLEPCWLEAAIAVHKSMVEKFHDHKAGGFFNTLEDQRDLLFRSKSASDGAVPSGNSVAALVSLKLGYLTGNPNLIDLAGNTLKAFGAILRTAGTAYSQMLIALDLLSEGGEQLVIVPRDGDQGNNFIEPLRRRFSPYLQWILADEEKMAGLSPLVMGKTAKGKTTAYVCRGTTCLPPVTEAEALLSILR